MGRAGSSGALNGWAYKFKAQGQLELALQLLAIARELYPLDANLYDSTGEMYLEKDDREQAILWYRKALEVDPGSTNAATMLERILPQSEE
jgi:tetratricopeptide (TPR) repeat protein